MRILRSIAWLLVVCCSAYAQSLPSGRSCTGPILDDPLDLALPSSIYIRVQLEKTAKISALKPGDAVEGTLTQDVYSGDRQLFTAGSQVHLTVDKLGRRRRAPNDHWPWIVKVFTPRHENYPTFQSAMVTTPDGKTVPLRVSLIFINREKEIRARAKRKKAEASARNGTTQPEDATVAPIPSPAQGDSNDAESAESRNKPVGPIVTFEAANPGETLGEQGATSGESSAATALPAEMTLGAGTRAKVVLLGGVSASKSRPGDFFQARLVEPIWLNAKVALPEGTLLGGKVVSRTPPRMLSRAGSILLVFTGLTVPGKSRIPIVASVTAAEMDRRSHTKIDAEGKMHGDRPGKAWMAINFGVTSGIAKEADDTIQLILEAFVSTATDASTAGVGKIVAACVSSVFLITRHGRDVVLPRLTEMDIVLDRPLHLGNPQPAPSAP